MLQNPFDCSFENYDLWLEQNDMGADILIFFWLLERPNVAHNVFEAGLKRFMHEPGYILEYADFLCRLNDDKNVRALFERALSSLRPEDSVEVWKWFSQFEQTYGDLTSMLKVEQRRKEALSRTTEEGALALESTLDDVVQRYSFMDLWPCSSKELDHLSRQEWLTKNMHKKVDKGIVQGANSIGSDKDLSKAFIPQTKVVYPDTSRMVIYDPRQSQAGPDIQAVSGLGTTTSAVALAAGGNTNANDELLKAVSPALAAFISHLPAVEGPSPEVDVVLSILLQTPISAGLPGKTASLSQLPGGPAPSTSDLSGSSKSRVNPNGSSQRIVRGAPSGKRKELERQEDDDTKTVQSRPLPRDVFKLRQMQMQRARGVSSVSQTGSAASGGSAFSGEQSISN